MAVRDERGSQKVNGVAAAAKSAKGKDGSLNGGHYKKQQALRLRKRLVH